MFSPLYMGKIFLNWTIKQNTINQRINHFIGLAYLKIPLEKCSGCHSVYMYEPDTSVSLCNFDIDVFRWRDGNQSGESAQNQGPTQKWNLIFTGLSVRHSEKVKMFDS